LEENADRWKKMFSMEEGGAVVRLRGDLTSENSVMWDPSLFRIIDHEHPMQGKKYRIWPTYDFAGAIEDSVHGVTHALRSKEYELRDELYFRILDLLGLRKPRLIEFSRLELEGAELSKRAMNKKVKEKGWSWDDPRLATLRGLRRRGITSQAIRELVLSLGVSKSEATVSWEILSSLNRKVVDPIARRFFFVADPVELMVRNAPQGMVKLKSHPSRDLGLREIRHDGEFFISAQEARDLEVGQIVRLKDLYNFRVEGRDGKIAASFEEGEFDRRAKKIEWVPSDKVSIDVLKVEGDELRQIRGYGERGIERLRPGEMVQLERFGFCRVDGPCRLIFTHR
jgi:glutamyl-tRNA synthetase